MVFENGAVGYDEEDRTIDLLACLSLIPKLSAVRIRYNSRKELSLAVALFALKNTSLL